MGWYNNNDNDRKKKEEYEEYLSDKAFRDSDDGDHGIVIGERKSTYRSNLSYDDYKQGKRL